jgi:hypothetical protein
MTKISLYVKELFVNGPLATYHDGRGRDQFLVTGA